MPPMQKRSSVKPASFGLWSKWSECITSGFSSGSGFSSEESCRVVTRFVGPGFSERGICSEDGLRRTGVACFVRAIDAEEMKCETL